MNPLIFIRRGRDFFVRIFVSALNWIYFLRHPDAARAIAAADVFDAEWYLAQNPDIAAAGIPPFTHFVRQGLIEGRNPSPRFNAAEYRFQNPRLDGSGANAFIDFISRPQEADAIVRKRFLLAQPLRFYRVPGQQARINLVVEALDVGTLSAGLGVAVIFAAVLANTSKASLRLIVRSTSADERSVRQILEEAGIGAAVAADVVFSYAAPGAPNLELDLIDGDTFITTSWLTTQSVSAGVGAQRVIYFVAQDERYAYPANDDYLRCGEVYDNSELRFVVSTRLLYDHLAGLGGIARRGIWLEPAAFGVANTPSTMAKKNFVFYGSPHLPQQLYYRGLEAIERAVQSGVLDPADWQITVVHKHLPPVRFGALEPQVAAVASWSDYRTLVGRTDLGLCLQYSPQPCQHVLDLAASGAVAVTSRYGEKQNLDHYCKNIMCSDTDTSSLVAAIALGAKLALNTEQRRANLEQAALAHDWPGAFADVIARLAKG